MIHQAKMTFASFAWFHQSPSCLQPTQPCLKHKTNSNSKIFRNCAQLTCFSRICYCFQTELVIKIHATSSKTNFCRFYRILVKYLRGLKKDKNKMTFFQNACIFIFILSLWQWTSRRNGRGRLTGRQCPLDLQKLLLRSLFSQQRRIGNISDTLIQSLGQTAQLWRTWTSIGTLIGMTGVMRRERLPLRFWRHVWGQRRQHLQWIGWVMHRVLRALHGQFQAIGR